MEFLLHMTVVDLRVRSLFLTPAQVCGDPNLCVIQYSWQIFCMMSQIKVLFLFHFPILVQLSKGFQIRPLWYEHLVCLRDWGSKPSSHAQLCWTKITPRQRSHSVAQQKCIQVVWLLQQILDRLNWSLSLPITLREFWATRQVLKSIWACETHEFCWRVLWPFLWQSRESHVSRTRTSERIWHSLMWSMSTGVLPGTLKNSLPLVDNLPC